ncbi:MAG: cyclopropane fatty acyl phospholipid synthase [Syntrophales bacterium]
MGTPSSETVVRNLLHSAGIEVNGNSPWDIQVQDQRFYGRLLREPHLTMGEGYMLGWWECEAIDQMIARIVLARLDEKVKGNWKVWLHILRSKLFNLQTSTRTFEVGRRHYDIGNDLYCAMLDRRLNYTCGYWKNATSLDEAQEAKLDLVCKKIGIFPGMRILELGCGWGGFAKYAAEMYGAQVLGVTISAEQVALGMELCKGLPVELRLQDYREVEGTYDAVISIGIMEHVGFKNYRAYMEVASRCLKKNGVAFIHTITGNESVTSTDPFAHAYLFPNGMLPSIAQLGRALENHFVAEDWHNIGPHYDHTLMAWWANFDRAWPELKGAYDERFRRMWRYYLLGSAGGFRSRGKQVWQVVMTRHGTLQPDCRFI